MLSKIYSAGVLGIEGFEVTVECSAWDRLAKFDLVGLPDAAVKEAASNSSNSFCKISNSGCFTIGLSTLQKNNSGKIFIARSLAPR